MCDVWLHARLLRMRGNAYVRGCIGLAHNNRYPVNAFHRLATERDSLIVIAQTWSVCVWGMGCKHRLRVYTVRTAVFVTRVDLARASRRS
jgi:hypothetical protein